MSKKLTGKKDLISATLKSVDLFSTWPSSALDTLSDATDVWSFDKGEAITVSGQHVEALVVLATGSVVNERTWENGKHMMSAVLRPYWPLKVHAVWDGIEAPYGLTARENSQALLIPRDVFLKVVKSDISLVASVLDFICRQLRHELIAVQMKTICSLRCQLAIMIFFHAQTSMHTIPVDQMRPNVEPMDVTQDEFAAMLGCSRQKINMLMRDMEKDGILRRHGRLVEVADPLLLMDAMEEDEPVSSEMKTFMAHQRELIEKRKRREKISVVTVPI